MVGTTTAYGQPGFNVMASSATEVSFQGPPAWTLTPFMRVAKDGTVGVSTYSAANLDVNGTGDDSSIGLMGPQRQSLRRRSQPLPNDLRQNGTADRRHAIRLGHSDSTTHQFPDF